jgi:O-antigen ligase
VSAATPVLRDGGGATVRAADSGTNLVEVLVVGGSVLAPLNLLVLRSFTVYDCVIGVALLLLLHQRRLIGPPRGYVLLALVFLLAALIGAFRATQPVEALTQILQYVFIFFVQVPVVLSVVRTRRAVLFSVLLLCVGSLAAMLHAYLTQDVQGSGRVLVFYSDNPNRLGYPTAYLMPLLAVLWFSTHGMTAARRTVAAFILVASAYLAVWALAASASRSSMLGTIAALVIFVALRPGLGLRRIALRLAALSAGLAVVAVVLAGTGQLPTTLEDRITRSFNGDVEDQNHLVADREHLANAGLRAFVESPYIGTGLDNFHHVTTRYDIEATPQLPHNLWLQLLVQVGVIGTLAFAGLIMRWLYDLASSFRRSEWFDQHLLWGLSAAMCGVLVIFLFAPEMIDRHYWLLFALGLAAVDGIRRHYQTEVGG